MLYFCNVKIKRNYFKLKYKLPEKILCSRCHKLQHYHYKQNTKYLFIIYTMPIPTHRMVVKKSFKYLTLVINIGKTDFKIMK